MTEPEYREYVATVEHYLKGLEAVSSGPCPGCEECGLPDEPSDAEYDAASEGGFSWSSCEVCGSPLGGDRYPLHGIDPETGSIVHMDCCTDCYYFVAYGQLDDQTMSEIGGAA